MKKTAPKYLTLQQLRESTQKLAYQFPVPPKSKPREDAAYLEAWKKNSVRPVQWTQPENPEPIAEFPDPCPKCGNHGAYLDIIPRPDNPVDPKNPNALLRMPRPPPSVLTTL
jgi:hypothetical protein